MAKSDRPVGTVGEGRFYLPPSKPSEDDEPAETAGTPEGRFYLPSGDDKAGESVAENPVEQAGLQAGDPPTSDEVKQAKADQKAADKEAASDESTSAPSVETTADPAATTVQPDPIAAASGQAGDPPTEDEVTAAKADQKAAGQPADPKPAKKAAASKPAAKKAASSNT